MLLYIKEQYLHLCKVLQTVNPRKGKSSVNVSPECAKQYTEHSNQWKEAEEQFTFPGKFFTVCSDSKLVLSVKRKLSWNVKCFAPVLTNQAGVGNFRAILICFPSSPPYSRGGCSARWRPSGCAAWRHPPGCGPARRPASGHTPLLPDPSHLASAWSPSSSSAASHFLHCLAPLQTNQDHQNLQTTAPRKKNKLPLSGPGNPSRLWGGHDGDGRTVTVTISNTHWILISCQSSTHIVHINSLVPHSNLMT